MRVSRELGPVIAFIGGGERDSYAAAERLRNSAICCQFSL